MTHHAGGGSPDAPLRVAVVIDTAPPWSKGGRERRLTELLRRLPSHNLDITVYTMRWWRRRPRGPIAYRAVCPRLRLYVGERRSVLQAVCFAIGSMRLLFEPFDVILADHMPYLHLFSLRFVAWARRRPLVVEWHERWSDDYWRQYLGRAGRVGAALERSALRLGDTIVADGASLGRELAQELGASRPVVTIPNAVDRRRAATIKPSSNAPDLLFIGRLIRHKRADVAIEALSQLRSGGRAVRLGVIGVGPELDALHSLAAERGVDDAVCFLGSIDDHDRVWSLLRGTKVLLAPSEREGFGLAVAEALAVGTPVVTVASSENEARHLVEVGRTGSVVPPGDPSAMASAARTWLSTEREPTKIAGAFWARHDELDWESSAAAYAELLVTSAGDRRRVK